jgi:hypothetical protein
MHSFADTAEIPHARLPLVCISLPQLLSKQHISKISVGNFVHCLVVYTFPNLVTACQCNTGIKEQYTCVTKVFIPMHRRENE